MLIITYSFNTVGPMIQALPDFLAENNYQDITSPLHTPLQKAYNTDLHPFAWLQGKPENFGYFNQFMATQRQDMPTWLDVYPWQDKTDGLKPEQPFFVDIGGGIGHQSIALREKVPQLPNKIILQDIPGALDHAIKHPGVEPVLQDFFQPQTITGIGQFYTFTPRINLLPKTYQFRG